MDEPGAGEQAFTSRASGDTPGQSKTVEYTLEALDANLTWTASIRADRIASDNWSQARRSQIEQAFLSSAKRSYADTVTAITATSPLAS